MENRDILASSYDYELPKELIATSLASPPDSAKLLVYRREDKSIIDTTFKDIENLIPKDTAIFLNNTKVIKARIFGKKESGGKVELLLLKPYRDNFLAMVRGRVKVGTKLIFQNSLTAVVKELLDDGVRVVEFFLGNKKVEFNQLIDILELIGYTPLPPYIDREVKEEDSKQYQSIFAKEAGSVAAPTASLHFTKELLKRLSSKFQLYYLTLHVGAGTFKPVEVEDIREHKMHSEFFSIPKETAKVIDSNKKILAVGTTATRTIEEYVRSRERVGESKLFLSPLNPPKRVNYLLTNFHLPKSTLIMLVSSFIGREETLRVYQHAIDKRYKFYSYGDAMLIL